MSSRIPLPLDSLALELRRWGEGMGWTGREQDHAQELVLRGDVDAWRKATLLDLEHESGVHVVVLFDFKPGLWLLRAFAKAGWRMTTRESLLEVLDRLTRRLSREALKASVEGGLPSRTVH